MYPMRDVLTGQYGYWSGTAWSIAPQFAAAYPFSGGRALVKSDSLLGYGFVSHVGKTAWLEDIVGYKVDANGFYDYFGNPCSVAACREQSGTVWLLNQQLRAKVVECSELRDAQDVSVVGSVLLARWQKPSGADTYGFVDFDGRRLFSEREIEGVRPSLDGFWGVKEQGSWSFLDVGSGATIAKPFVDLAPFNSGLGAVFIDERWYVIDDRLQVQFESHFDRIDMFSNGYAVAYQAEHCGYLATNGNFSTFTEYAELGSVNRHGIGVGNRDTCEWTLDLIKPNGVKILGSYSAVDFTDGDFPQFELWKGDVLELYSPASGPIALPPHLK